MVIWSLAVKGEVSGKNESCLGLFHGMFRSDYSSNYLPIQYKQYLTGSDRGSHTSLGVHGGGERAKRATWQQIGPTGFSPGPRSMCDWEQYLNLPIAEAVPFAIALENGFMPERCFSVPNHRWRVCPLQAYGRVFFAPMEGTIQDIIWVSCLQGPSSILPNTNWCLKCSDRAQFLLWVFSWHGSNAQHLYQMYDLSKQ